MKPSFSKLLPHLFAFLILLVVVFARFSPSVFGGKTLQASDMTQAFGMQAESRKIEGQVGTYPLWTNGAFAGMPTYQILYPTSNPIYLLSKVMLLGNSMASTHTDILLACLGFYILLVVLGIDWRVSLFGALSFGLAANNMHLAAGGHLTKIVTMGYLAPVLAGLVLSYRGKYWLGGGLTAVFMALQINANHVQITYYFGLSLLFFGIAYFLDALKKGQLPQFAKATGVSVLAFAIAFATNAGRLMTTEEYSQETIRGKSELTQKDGSSGSKAGESGLSKDYAFQWSYGKLETFNLLIPNYVGGSSSESFASDPESATIQELRKLKSADEATNMAQATTHYWGGQPFTGGGVYLGAIVALLFILGLILVKSPLKWYAVGAATLGILLGWGKYFEGFNYFLFDTFPMMNKFRAVTMALGITNFAVVLLAAMGLQALFDKNLEEGQRKKSLLLAGGITAGITILGLLLGFSLDYVKDGESFPPAIAEALAADRAALLQADALRTLLFMALGFAVLWAWQRYKFSAALAAIALAGLSMVDILPIGARMLKSEDFTEESAIRQLTAPTKADETILKDPDPHYRVADFRRGNPFSNALSSYHHKSMGGYHAAKLMRYQELVERYLSNPEKYRNIYGMFNAKYFIGQGDQVIGNSLACGNAWFVRSFEVVENADAEIAALDSLQPKEKAIIQKAYLGDLEGFQPSFDSAATIKLTRYHPDTLTYSFTCASDQLAVFSEMYYPPSKGWGMFIDGQKAGDFTKANFALRAAKLPAGTHELKMVFSPSSYHKGETIALIAALIAIAFAAFGIYWFLKNYEFPSAANLPEAAPATKPKPAATKAKPTDSKKR